MCGIKERVATFIRAHDFKYADPPGYQPPEPPAAVSQDGGDPPRLSAMGWLATAVAVFALIASVYTPYARDSRHSVCDRGHRFQDDNAQGATANAVERIQDTEEGTQWFLYAMIAMVIVALERVRMAVVWQGKILLSATHRKDLPDESGGG